MKSKLKQQKGITLIALVVTIIILLILAGVAINMTTGDNGLFQKAKEARERAKQLAEDEKVKMSISFAWLNEGNFSMDALKSDLTKQGMSYIENSDGSIEVTTSGTEFTITKEGKVTEIETDGKPVLRYNISYDGNGADEGSKLPIDTISYKEKSTVCIDFSINPQRLGYEFMGWSIDKNATEATYVKGKKESFEMPKGDVTLYAVWKAHFYTVIYDGNGADGGNTEESIHEIDKPSNLTKNGYTKTNYKFEGWSTSINGEVEYEDEDSVINLTTNEGEAVTLYAVWDIQIVYLYNGELGNTLDSKNIPLSECGSLTGGWILGYYANHGTGKKISNSNEMGFEWKGIEKYNTYNYCGIYTNNKIDLSGYSKLKAEIKSSSTSIPIMCYSANEVVYDGPFQPGGKIFTGYDNAVRCLSTQYTVVEIDITQENGLCGVAFCADPASVKSVNGYCKKIWLEK